jgi:dTMP kinase
MRKSKFITIEGPDGSGKGTLIKNIVDWLSPQCNFIFTKEPGSQKDKFCVKLRKFILDPKNDIDDEAEIYLYMADRCQHVNRVILPALETEDIVLCDRYIDSTFAYQGFGRRRGDISQLDKINYLNRMTTNGLLPDLTIILMVKPEIGLSRIVTKEFGKPDRLEKEVIDFHQRVCEGYNYLVKNYSRIRNFAVIDTTLVNAQNTFNLAKSFIEPYLPKK